MIRICFIIGQLSKSGAETQLYYLVKNLNKSSYDKTVISLSTGGYWRKHLKADGIRVIELKRRSNKEISRLIRLIQILKKIRPHIVHTFLPSANTYGRIAAFFTHVPVILSSERNIPEIGKDKTILQYIFDRILFKVNDCLICNTKIASDILIHKYHFSSSRVRTVYNGINCENFIRPIKLLNSQPKEKLIIANIGQFRPQKNQTLFIKLAWECIHKRKMKNMEFWIVGEGALRSILENLIQKYYLSEHVLLLGECHNMQQIYSQVDVLVVTSLYEGLSNVIMEAMLAGVPVVASNAEGNRELITDNIDGLLFKNNDLMDLTSKFITLLNDNKLFAKLQRNGKQKILNRFGINRMVELTQDIYTRLLQEKLPFLSTGSEKWIGFN